MRALLLGIAAATALALGASAVPYVPPPSGGGSSGPKTVYTSFTSSGTYTIPSGAVTCDYFAVAGGASGLNGKSSIASVQSGAGGSPGNEKPFYVGLPCPATGTVLTVTIGAGAAAPTTGSGGAGNAGSLSSITGTGVSVFAYPAGAGAYGPASAFSGATAGGSSAGGNSTGTNNGTAGVPAGGLIGYALGGAGASNSAANTPAANAVGPSGGGAGGGYNTGTGLFFPGSNANQFDTTTQTLGGATAGANGASAPCTTIPLHGNSGAGGAGGNLTTPGGNGGVGCGYGAGGGGGGSVLAAASFTASVAATTNVLVVSAVASGTIAIGQYVYGTGIADPTTITAGSGTTWTLSTTSSAGVASEAMVSGVQIGHGAGGTSGFASITVHM